MSREGADCMRWEVAPRLCAESSGRPSCCSPGLDREAVVTLPAPSKSQEKGGGLELNFVI